MATSRSEKVKAIISRLLIFYFYFSESSSKDFSGEGGFFREEQDCEIVSWTNPRPKPVAPLKSPNFDLPDLCSSDSEIQSPLMDVEEAGISPTSSQIKKSVFNFSPVKDKKSFKETVLNIGDNIKDQEDTQNLVNLGSGNELENCNYSKASEVKKLHNRQQQYLGGISAQDGNEDDRLLKQIMDKKKELDDLIKKWENSKNEKTVIDLTASAHDGNIIAEGEELASHNTDSLEVIKPSEQERNLNAEEIQNIQPALDTGDHIVEQEKTVDTFCVSESDSEASSVEEITALINQPKVGVIEGARSDNGMSLEVDSSDATSEPQGEVKEKIQGK